MNKGRCRHSICEEAKAEVAREIFEEIERVLSMHFCSCLPKGSTEHYDYYEGDLGDAIAELKKKYTQDCRNCKHMVSCEPNVFGTCDDYEGVET